MPDCGRFAGKETSAKGSAGSSVVGSGVAGSPGLAQIHVRILLPIIPLPHEK